MQPTVTMRLQRCFALAPLLLALASCARVTRPTAYDRQARDFLAVVHRGDSVAALRMMLRTDTMTAGALATLGFASRYFATVNLESAELVGWNVEIGATQRADLTYEVRRDTGWVLVGLNLSGAGDSAKVGAFRWKPLPRSLHAANDFRLRGKSVGLLAFLGVGALFAALHLFAGVAAVRARLQWWWIVAAWIGVGHVAMDWNTGAWTVKALAVHLFSVGSQRTGLAGPWTIMVGLPLGAIATLWAVRRRRAKVPVSQPAA